MIKKTFDHISLKYRRGLDRVLHERIAVECESRLKAYREEAGTAP